MSKAATSEVVKTKEEITTILTVTGLMTISDKEFREVMDVTTLTEPQ